MAILPDPRWHEIDRILADTLERDERERDGFVEAACAGDPELLKAVQGLLDVSEEANEFLEEPLLSLPPGLWRELTAEEEPEQEVIGAYRVLRRLGRGGMGTVYLAERVDGEYDQKVAIKLLRRGLDTEDILARFRAERQILASLNHPNIAHLLDGGSTSSGLPYLVMEHVEGEPITEYCDRNRLPIDQRLELFLSVAAAVAHAHERGVLHRDLKPSNILVSTGGWVKLLDFGIARLLSNRAGTARTRTGVRLLTPEYAAPEQIRGGALTPATDVYQLGILLYELLTGCRPFEGAAQDGARIPPPIRPGSAIPARGREASQDVTPDPFQERLWKALDAIVIQALQDEPSRRYASVPELAADLRRAVAQQPVRATTRRWNRVLRWRQRFGRKHGTAVLVAAVLLLIAGGAGIALAPRGAPSPRTIAVLPFGTPGGDDEEPYLSNGFTEEIIDQLSVVRDLRVMSPSSVRAYRDTERPLSEVARELGVSAVLRGSIRREGDTPRVSAQLVDAKSGEPLWEETFDPPRGDLLAIQSEIALRSARALGVRLSREERGRMIRSPTRSRAAYELEMRTRNLIGKGLEKNETAVEMLKQAIALDPSFADAYAGLAGAYMQRAQVYGYPDAWADSGLVVARKAVALAPRSPRAHSAVGINLNMLGRYEEGEAAYRRALELNPSYALVLNNLGSLYNRQGRYDEAARVLLRAQQLDPRSSYPAVNLGNSYLLLGMWDQAGRWLDRAEELGHAPSVVAHYRMWLLLSQGKIREASDYVQAVYDRNPADPSVMALLGYVAGVDGRWEDSRRYLRAGFQKNPTGGYTTAYALALWQLGERDEAKRILEESSAVARREWEQNQEAVSAPVELASAASIQGKRDEALYWLEQVYRAGGKWAAWMRVNPAVQALRNDPRFRDLVARMEADIARMRQQLATGAEPVRP